MAKTSTTKKNTKTVVRVAWNRAASDLLEEKGWAELKKAAKKKKSDLIFEEVEFDTPAEANAYMRGIGDGNGWDEPSYLIKGEK